MNRNLEPYRGFHSFVRAIPEIQRRCPECRIIIVGGDKVSYGAPLPKGQTYRSKYLQELKGQIDLSRVHFVGTLPYQHFLSMLQVSRVHVYLTYPFVLSWSMLEAMSCGVPSVSTDVGCGARFAGAGAGGSVWALGEKKRIQDLKALWRATIAPIRRAGILDCAIDPRGVR